MPTIETDLKDILAKIDNRLEKIDDRLVRLETGQAEMKSDLNALKEDVKDLKTTQRSQLWALIITIIGTLTAGVIRFGFFTNP